MRYSQTTKVDNPNNAPHLSATPDNYLDHFLYRAALRHLQKGEWDEGLIEMVWLAEIYPLNQEIRTLINEMELRSQIDKEEAEEKQEQRRQRSKKIMARGIIVLASVVILLLSGSYYSGWISTQTKQAQQRLDEEISLVELGGKFRDAQALLQAGDSAEAKILIEEIASTHPDYPGLAVLFVEVDSVSEIDGMYRAALRNLEDGDIGASTYLLSEIYTLDPSYKDVEALLATLERQITHEELILEADVLVRNKDWASAILLYSEILNSESPFRKAYIEDRLFESYLNAAEQAIAMGTQAQISREAASELFQEARKLRPQDSNVRAGEQRAELYLAAKDSFLAGNWEETITTLDFIFPDNLNYAEGTALQMLIEAHLARGDRSSANEDLTLALVDYEAATNLSGMDDAADLRYYTTLVRTGNGYLSIGDPKQAVNKYLLALNITAFSNLLLSNHPDLIADYKLANTAVEESNYAEAGEVLHSLTSELMSALGTRIYQVEEGDNIILVASRFGTTLEAITNHNDLSIDTAISPGQELSIPFIPG